MSRFVYHNTLPSEVKAALAPHLEALTFLVPGWCECVNVLWSEKAEDECSMQTRVYFDYRFAEVFVTPLWLSCREDIRASSVLHELLHLHLNPLFDYVSGTLDAALEGQDRFRAHAKEGLRAYSEGAIEDLAIALKGRL